VDASECIVAAGRLLRRCIKIKPNAFHLYQMWGKGIDILIAEYPFYLKPFLFIPPNKQFASPPPNSQKVFSEYFRGVKLLGERTGEGELLSSKAGIPLKAVIAFSLLENPSVSKEGKELLAHLSEKAKSRVVREIAQGNLKSIEKILAARKVERKHSLLKINKDYEVCFIRPSILSFSLFFSQSSCLEKRHTKKS